MTGPYGDAIATVVINWYSPMGQALYEALSLHNLSDFSRRLYEG